MSIYKYKDTLYQAWSFSQLKQGPLLKCFLHINHLIKVDTQIIVERKEESREKESEKDKMKQKPMVSIPELSYAFSTQNHPS